MDNKVLDQMMMALMGASPTDDQRMANLDDQPVVQILPDANVVKIGGQSFIDRGRAAVFSLIDEIVENLLRHKMIIGTGAGTRARHAYSVGLDLGMPTGLLSVLGASAIRAIAALSGGASGLRLRRNAALCVLATQSGDRPHPPSSHRYRLLSD